MSARYDIYASAVDFYVTEALWLEVKPRLQPFRHSHEKFRADLFAYQRAYTQKFARALYDYLVLICFGEMRHADRLCRKKIENFKYYGESRDCALQGARKYSPDSIIATAREIFSARWTCSSYGGGSWLRIAEAAGMYGTIPDAAFVDHCVDLSHNGGLCFDKLEANIFELRAHSDTYRRLLDAKAALAPNDFIYRCSLINYVSKTLYRLIFRAVELRLLLDRGVIVHMPKVMPYSDADRLLEYVPVEWGRKRLGRVVDNTIVVCHNCEDNINLEDDKYYEYDWKYYCQSCYDELFTSCYECGGVYPKSSMRLVDGWWYCESCYDNTFVECVRCWRDVAQDDACWLDDDAYCEHCFGKVGGICAGCDEAFYKSDLLCGDDGKYYCPSCFEERFDDDEEGEDGEEEEEEKEGQKDGETWPVKTVVFPPEKFVYEGSPGGARFQVAGIDAHPCGD